MVSHLSSIILAIFLLPIAADGRTIKGNLDHENVSSSNASLLDSTNSGTTNYNDVIGLTALMDRFQQLVGTQFPYSSKDPCYPEKLAWIECTNSAPRRVIALYLGNQRLYGSLPDFSSMDALQTIDLHQNILFGPIPDFFGAFPELTYLNLANNGFSGPIPYSLSKNKKIKLDLSGNPSFCSSSISCSPPISTQSPFAPIPRGDGTQYPWNGDFANTYVEKDNNLPVILAATIVPIVLLTFVCFAICRHRKNVDDCESCSWWCVVCCFSDICRC